MAETDTELMREPAVSLRGTLTVGLGTGWESINQYSVQSPECHELYGLADLDLSTLKDSNELIKTLFLREKWSPSERSDLGKSWKCTTLKRSVTGKQSEACASLFFQTVTDVCTQPRSTGQ